MDAQMPCSSQLPLVSAPLPVDVRILSDCLNNSVVDGTFYRFKAGYLIDQFISTGTDRNNISTIITMFIKQHANLITKVVDDPEMLNPNNFKIFIHCTDLLAKLNFEQRQTPSVGKLISIEPPKLGLNLPGAMPSINNMTSIFEVPETVKKPFIKNLKLTLMNLKQPEAGLPPHRQLGHFLFLLLTQVTDPATAIQEHTFRNFPKTANTEFDPSAAENRKRRRNQPAPVDFFATREEEASNDEKANLIDLPSELVDVLKALFCQYLGLDNEIIQNEIINPDVLEQSMFYKLLGESSEERFENITTLRTTYMNYKDVVFPTVLKRTMCEIRGCTAVTSADNKTTWCRRKRSYKKTVASHQNAF